MDQLRQKYQCLDTHPMLDILSVRAFKYGYFKSRRDIEITQEEVRAREWYFYLNLMSERNLDIFLHRLRLLD